MRKLSKTIKGDDMNRELKSAKTVTLTVPGHNGTHQTTLTKKAAETLLDDLRRHEEVVTLTTQDGQLSIHIER